MYVKRSVRAGPFGQGFFLATVPVADSHRGLDLQNATAPTTYWIDLVRR